MRKREFRFANDPRKNIPLVTHDGGTWQMSVRDANDNHHVRCFDTWGEAMTSARMWAHVNGLIPA